MNWFDKEVELLEDDLSNGLISEKEFRQEMSLLRAELQGQAEGAAEQAYNDVIGIW